MAAASRLMGLAACGGSDDQQPGGEATVAANPEGIDDGAKLTLWTRAALEAQAKALVKAYNESHKNQVELTDRPHRRLPGPGRCGGRQRRPAGPVRRRHRLRPQLDSSGPLRRHHRAASPRCRCRRVNQSHITAGTYEDKKYVVPFILDLSVIFYNKDLYREAGLDPEKGPPPWPSSRSTRWPEAEQADVYGTYFGGNCGGCDVFTWWPIDLGQRRGGDERRRHRLEPQRRRRQEGVRHLPELLRGGIVAPGAKDETGATWVGTSRRARSA